MATTKNASKEEAKIDVLMDEDTAQGAHDHDDCGCGCSGEGMGCKIKKIIKYGVVIAVIATAGYYAWKYFKG